MLEIKNTDKICWSRLISLQKNLEIDEIDVTILKMLLRDARTSFTQIAEECEISVSAVKSRFERLKKRGIITGAIMQINPQSLGYTFVADIVITTSVHNIKDVMTDLKTKSYVVLGCDPFPRFKIEIFVVLTKLKELTKIQEDLESHPLIKETETLIWVESTHMDHVENLVFKPSNKLGNPKQERATIQTSESVQQYIDETDKQIAKMISHDARMPFNQIARQIGISTKNVIQRYVRLRGRLLTLSTITIDLKKLGYHAMVNIHIKATNKSAVPNIWAQMLETPNILVAIRVIGKYDLLLMGVLEDFQDLFKLSEKVLRIEGVDQADIFLREPDSSWPPNIFVPLLDQ